jgi:beta-galactosidase
MTSRHLLDTAWEFHLGDVPAPMPNTHTAAYMANKAGWSRGAARGSYDDSDWPVVQLPHDWSVEGKFDPENHVDAGFLPRGVAWYRRHFRLDPADRGRNLAIQFDAVATHCTVYINGHLLHRNFCGYTAFTVDFSDVANFGDELNVVSVRVDANYMEGWWYEGAGIYRHVWLIKTSPVHVIPHGVFVSPTKIAADHWETCIETTVENSSDKESSIKLVSDLLDPSGKEVGTAHNIAEIPARSVKVIAQTLPTHSPAIWSLESPNLYRVKTEIRILDDIADDCITPFGYRTIRFDPDSGFFLNDQPIKLKGTCNHQDHAGVGVAVPDSIQRFRIRRLLDMGCNAYRCAHNPPAPELLDACDELGMLVMDETRNFGSSPENLSQLETMILRDRNHPSVILWSICNEEPVQGTAVGANIAKTMQQLVHRLDPTRPVTAAVSGGVLNDNCIADVIQIMGLNYQLPLLDEFHARHPRTPLFAAETHSMASTRGVYLTDPSKFQIASDDSVPLPWGATARQTWHVVSSRPFVAGLFAWTGFDYRGEPSPHHWPCVSSFFGILDTCGFAKDSFFLHKAFFTAEPFVHILPHWNWPGREGKPIRVAVYTNCPAAELFVNGKSLGRQAVDAIEMAHWTVEYQPGELRAIVYRDDQIIAESTVRTTGPATALGLEIHPSFDARKIPADGQFALPITVFALDSQSRRVPTANNFVEFSVQGPAKILGVGNGDPTCHEPDKAQSRSLFNGLAQVILRTALSPGPIRLTAKSPGVDSATLSLHSIAVQVPLSVPVETIRYLISDWRMSPITPNRPDVNKPEIDQDMNSWQRIDPAKGSQSAWSHSPGYAIYRAKFRLPKTMKAQGARLIFSEIIGQAEVFLNGKPAGKKIDAAPASLEITIPPTGEEMFITVVVRADAASAGVSQVVELRI